MIFKPRYAYNPPKGRIDNVIYWGAAVVPLNIVVVGFDTDTDSLKFWDGSTWLAAAAAANVCPPGTTEDFAGTVAPAGYLECDGSAVSRTTYAALFAAIGVVWGVGDGVTTFNLPDCRGRSRMGSGTGSGLSARSVGQSFGVETVTLSTGEIPSHSHSLDVDGHSNAGTGSRMIGNTNDLSNTPIVFDQLGATSFTPLNNVIEPAGGGGAHTNVQPTAVFMVIIKT